MHICADEIIAFVTGISAAQFFLPRVRAYLKGLFARPAPVEVAKAKSFPELFSGELEDEAVLLKQWVDDVAPTIVRPEADKYSGRHMLHDGTGYLVNGRIWPVYPLTKPSDYVVGDKGWQLATPEESQKMRG